MWLEIRRYPLPLARLGVDVGEVPLPTPRVGGKDARWPDEDPGGRAEDPLRSTELRLCGRILQNLRTIRTPRTIRTIRTFRTIKRPPPASIAGEVQRAVRSPPRLIDRFVLASRNQPRIGKPSGLRNIRD